MLVPIPHRVYKRGELPDLRTWSDFKVLYPMKNGFITTRKGVMTRRDMWYSRVAYNRFGLEIEGDTGWCRVSQSEDLLYKNKNVFWSTEVDAALKDCVVVRGWEYAASDVYYALQYFPEIGVYVASFLLSGYGIIKNRYGSKREQYHIWKDTSGWIRPRSGQS